MCRSTSSSAGASRVGSNSSSRSSTSNYSCRRCGTARRARANAMPASFTARTCRASSSSAWKWYGATGPNSPNRCNANCICDCSPGSLSISISLTLSVKVRRGELDHALVYRKGLRKDVREYTASTPPHVAAARKSSADPGRLVAYVMTTAGPEPTRQSDAPARPNALRHKADQAGRRTGARCTRAGFRPGHRRRPPDRFVLTVTSACYKR